MGKASRRKRDHHQSDAPAFAQATTNALPTASPQSSSPNGALSAAIIELIEPYRHEATTLRSYKLLVGLATLGWNLALVPDAERQKLIANAIREIDISNRAAVQELIENFRQRKTDLFPHDKRLVVGSEVTMTPTGFRVTVTSARAA